MEHVHRVSTLDEVNVRVRRNHLNNVLGGLDLAHGDDTRSSFLDSQTDHVGALGITLSFDDGGLRLFLLTLDDKLGPLGVLLSHLLLLDGCGELPRERQVRERDIVEDQSERLRPGLKLLANVLRDFFSHRDQLGGIVLSNDRLEHFSADRRQNSVIVVLTNVVQDHRQLVLLRPEQYTQRKVHRLEIPGARERGNLAVPGPDLEVLRRLQKRNLEVHAFGVDFVRQASRAVEEQRALATVDDEDELGSNKAEAHE